MGLNVEMDSYDYDQAIKAVQAILDDIEAVCDCEEGKPEIRKMPKADDIVDAVWDAIK